MKAVVGRFALLTGLLIMGSCSSKDSLEDEDWCLRETYKTDMIVKIKLDDKFRQYCMIDTVFETRSSDSQTQLKYYLVATPQNSKAGPFVFSSFSNDIPVRLTPGKYSFVGWADYESPADSRGVNFYTDDMAELLLRNKYNYSGASIQKIGYRGSKDASVSYTTKKDSVTISPAMGLYRLEATDTSDWKPVKVKVSYTSLLPAAINAMTGEINWWWSDISYSYPIGGNLADNGNLLASDYVYSQETETSVTVTVEIYDDNNIIRARKKNLKIPLVNGGITTVRGNFLSVFDRDREPGGAGISIKTEWDATFEIEL